METSIGHYQCQAEIRQKHWDTHNKIRGSKKNRKPYSEVAVGEEIILFKF